MGIGGFYCNYGAENSKETIEDLNQLGFQDVSAIFLKINSLFPVDPLPRIWRKKLSA
jgi:hypothetical protein